MGSKRIDGVRRTDKLWVENPDMIQVIPGFNARSDLGDLTELQEDIKDNGVLTSLWVRPDKANEKQPFILIAGERRLTSIRNLWAQGVRDIRIPIEVHNVDEEQAEELMAKENLRRKDLTVMDLMGLITRWEKKGLTDKEVGKKLGRSEAWVGQIRTLSGAHSSVKNAVSTGDLTMGPALDLARKVPVSEQSDVLDAALAEAGGKKGKLRKAIAKRTGTKLRPGKKDVALVRDTLTNLDLDNDAKKKVRELVLNALEYSSGNVSKDDFLRDFMEAMGLTE